ncbi:alpha-galactosidase [Bacillus sp. FJAT-49711]|uniref:Sip1-related alpha-galactosidase n=1 Tax=Bacillus sp. FJAT-49711 TaxID=2833585 RepID=UPI001BCA36FF|nr:Sip1-related alpha-galactosidase [Bacillus sp. FJAT-49711]MBS4220901.1 alpha-galactosidase [Bacillus sp. FJAT-49711]
MNITNTKKTIRSVMLSGSITPIITLDDQSKFLLKYIKTVQNSEIHTTHYFSNDESGINLEVMIKKYGKIIALYVGAKIKNERDQARHRYFAAEKSISLLVQDIDLIDGLMANYQHKDWWTRPYFKNDLSQMPERTISLLMKSKSEYHYILPVVDKDYRADLAGHETGLSIHLSSYVGGFDSCKTLALFIGTGENPFKLSENTIKTAIAELGYPTLPRDKKRYPKTLDYLGWCSWDAFYHHVNESGIIKKMEELKEKELPVKWVMIDDGWLDVKENRLFSFKAHKGKFPNGLQSISKKLKEQYGVYWVGVWHTIAGYWGGIHKDSELAKIMETFLYKTNNNKMIPSPDAAKGFDFWDRWHRELKQKGIDFVKVDSQSAVNNFMMYQESIGKTARGAHTALEASVGIHFDQCIINCMGMSSENIWNRPISSVSRNSDDFVPGEEISFKEHALQNAYNSFFHSHFYWGDWDMYWTNHAEGIQNAILRAVSGGPVYFSDPVGETDACKIRPLILNDGQILRANQPGLPTSDCLFSNPNEQEVPLKVWNTANDAGVIAAFNIHLENKEVHGTISPSDVQGIKGEKFVIYDYLNEKVFRLEVHEKMHIS